LASEWGCSQAPISFCDAWRVERILVCDSHRGSLGSVGALFAYDERTRPGI